MIKSIFIQLWNRKGSNLRIAIELLLVFCITWYIVDFFFVLQYNKAIPNYRNLENVYQVKLGQFTSEHPEYRAEADEAEVVEANYQRILQFVRSYPGVEEVSISFSRSAPGHGSYWGMGVMRLDDSIRVCQGQRVTIDPAGDFFRTFRYSQGRGEKAVSTKDFDWDRPNAIVIGQRVKEQLYPNEAAVGQRLRDARQETEYTIVGVVDDTKRFSHERPQLTFYLPQKSKASNIRHAEISVRCQPAVVKHFREQFKRDMTDPLRIGNFYLLNVIPYTRIEADTTRSFGKNSAIKSLTSLMIFFLLNILLCVMGTFWYRINRRVDEIGLRKAIGSTNSDIRRLLLLEGICLLSVVLLPAMALEMQFAYANVDLSFLTGFLAQGYHWGDEPGYLPGRLVSRFLITNGITFVLLSLVVMAAIWLPAVKASRLAPAEALRDE
ncbi:ABC transporter permease [Parabacteroides sp. OttesenSCG-928-N08]|nr:ABC transporter permease [Parabacteroides sp. OttesenSCG-928-N08]